jgi:hypothetical protein
VFIFVKWVPCHHGVACPQDADWWRRSPDMEGIAYVE